MSKWEVWLRATLIQSGLFKAQRVYQWKPRLSGRWRLRPFWFSDVTDTLEYRVSSKLSLIRKDVRDWWYGW